jgi:hypothetical protein
MQATTHSDVFAFKNSGLDACLYAEVGAELNGSALTILSMIARLGRDPWAEAARWAALPRAGAIDGLAQSISQMPLVPSAMAETRATAARLVQLLPTTTPGLREDRTAKANAPSVQNVLPITFLWCVMALGMALIGLLAPKPPQAVGTSTEQPWAGPIAAAARTVPRIRAEPIAGSVAAPTDRQSK